MSHFTKLENVAITDIKAFLKAAKELGFEKVDTKTMNGYQGNTMDAEVVVRHPKCKYDIGLVKKDKGYEMVSDWWGIQYDSGLNIGNPAQELGQLTTKHTLTRKYAELGFTASSKKNENGDLVLRLRR